MSRPENKIAQHLRSLHQPGNPLILTNVYDAATASIIASLPTAQAVATASYAVASSLGVSDDDLTKAGNLAALGRIAAAVRAVNPSKPVTVDLQDGYGTDLAELAATIREVIDLGAVGCNLEDVNNATGQLRSLSESVERVKTVVAAAAEAGVPDFVVNARTDVLFLQDGATIADSIERGKAFLEAGACTVFVWGGPGGRGLSGDEIAALVKELEGKVNVKMSLREGSFGIQEIRELGVARVSLGPEVWRVAMDVYREQAERILALPLSS